MESIYEKTVKGNRLILKELLYDNGFLLTATPLSSKDPNIGVCTIQTTNCECCKTGAVIISEIDYDSVQDFQQQLRDLFLAGDIVKRINNSKLNDNDKETLIQNYEDKFNTLTKKRLESSIKNINPIK